MSNLTWITVPGRLDGSLLAGQAARTTARLFGRHVVLNGAVSGQTWRYELEVTGYRDFSCEFWLTKTGRKIEFGSYRPGDPAMWIAASFQSALAHDLHGIIKSEGCTESRIGKADPWPTLGHWLDSAYMNPTSRLLMRAAWRRVTPAWMWKRVTS